MLPDQVSEAIQESPTQEELNTTNGCFRVTTRVSRLRYSMDAKKCAKNEGKNKSRTHFYRSKIFLTTT